MRNVISALIGGAAVAMSWPAGAASPDLSETQKAAVKLISQLSDKELQQVLQAAGPRREVFARAPAEAAKPAAPKTRKLLPNELPDTPAGTDSSEIPLLGKRNQKSPNQGCVGWIPLLRQDWKDIGFASCPDAIDKATGAQASVSGDRVKNNVNWTLQGMAAMLYNTRAENSRSSIGAYVTANRSFNSAQSLASKNVDTTGFGGLLEYGFSNGTSPYYANYFRVRGGGVQDHIKNTTIGTVTGEWLPVVNDGFVNIHNPFNPVPGVPLIVRIDPVLLVQYSAESGSPTGLAFNGRPQALRIGPQVSLNLYPGTDPEWSRIFGSLTYHWAHEATSGHNFSLLQASVTYNLDSDGYFALTGSYQRGNDEDTGTWMNTYKVALSGKI